MQFFTFFQKDELWFFFLRSIFAYLWENLLDKSEIYVISSSTNNLLYASSVVGANKKHDHCIALGSFSRYNTYQNES